MNFEESYQLIWALLGAFLAKLSIRIAKCSKKEGGGAGGAGPMAPRGWGGLKGKKDEKMDEI